MARQSSLSIASPARSSDHHVLPTAASVTTVWVSENYVLWLWVCMFGWYVLSALSFLPHTFLDISTTNTNSQDHHQTILYPVCGLFNCNYFRYVNMYLIKVQYRSDKLLMNCCLSEKIPFILFLWRTNLWLIQMLTHLPLHPPHTQITKHILAHTVQISQTNHV